MKKTEISLLICAFFTAVLLCSCNFNLSDNKYLERPDVIVRPGFFEVGGSYINTNTKSITIFRQNVHDSDTSEIERVAILFPEGVEDTADQTFHYDDKMVLAGDEYRYYLIFTDKDGKRNRTEWSTPKKLESGGAGNNSSLIYNTNNLKYVYDQDTMVIKLPTGQDFTAPGNDVITDISSYSPALVFQAGDNIQVFEIADTTYVNLRDYLPRDFLIDGCSLLGVLGQKIEKNSQDKSKYVSWTKLATVGVQNSAGNAVDTIKEKDAASDSTKIFDYSTNADNEE